MLFGIPKRNLVTVVSASYADEIKKAIGTAIFFLIRNKSTQNMPKRFTDNAIWKKGWFMRLPAHIKLFWQYLRDDCDAAGVWEPNFDVASLFVGKQVTEADLEHFGDRVEKIENGKYWLTGFIEFQYNNNLSEKSPAHKPIFSSINKNKIDNRVFNRVSNRLQEKDKEKDKEEYKESPEENLENVDALVPNMLRVFCELNKSYHKEQERDFPELFKIAQTMSRNKTPGLELIPSWKILVEFIIKHDFYKDFSIKQINNNIQSILLSQKNGSKTNRGNTNSGNVEGNGGY